MNTAYKWLFLALLFATPAFAQNVRVDNVAFSSVQGFPFLPSATITVCTAAGAGTPCAPTVNGLCLSISDTVCSQSPTITADALGNYGFWIQPGSYTYTITKAGFGGFGPKPLMLAFATSNSTIICDGVKYTTIQAAAAALPATGGEVIVPSASVCTWNGAGMTGSVTVRFLSANATYPVSGPIIMTGGLNHLVCQSGQPIGDASINGTTGGTILTWGTGALTASQDAISASSNSTNDHNTVEGCKIRILNGVGRHCINWSGTNHTIVRNAVLDDCTTDGYHLETGPNHAYDNLVDHVDVIHVGGAGAHLFATAATNDIDRTTFINFNYHPQDPVGNVGGSTGEGVLLEAPSGCTVNCRITNTTFVGSLINGTANGTAGIELRVSQAGINAGTIQYFSWTNGEIEDVFQSNTATGFLITDTSNLDVQNVWLVSPSSTGYNAGTNISRSNATAYFYRPFPFGANRAGGSFLSDYAADVVSTGTAAMTTASIAAVSGTTVTCGATVTVAATDTVSTDTITVAPNAVESNPNTGLILRYWPTGNNVNFAWCNPTASALTPVAETVNWRVIR